MNLPETVTVQENRVRKQVNDPCEASMHWYYYKR